MNNDAPGIVSTLQYLCRRVLRIYPLFAIVVVYTATIGYGMPAAQYDMLWMKQHLLFVWGDGYLWTVKQEMVFYLLLPIIYLLMLAANFKKNYILTAGALTVIAYITTIILTPNFLSLQVNATATIKIRIAPFLLGIAAACIARSGRVHLSGATTDFILSLILSLLFLALPYFFPKNIRSVEMIYYLGFAAVVLLLAQGTSGSIVTRLFCLKPIRTIGVIGYGFYLWHWPVECALWYIAFLNNVPFDPTLLFFSVVLVTTLLASITYLLVEKPFMSIGRNWARSG